MNLDMNLMFERLFDENPVRMSLNEKVNYESIIRNKKIQIN